MEAFTSCCLIRGEQRGANARLCGRARWPTNPATNSDFTTGGERLKESQSLWEKLAAGSLLNIWRSLLGAESGRGGTRKNMPVLIVCMLAAGRHDGQGFSRPGHYSIKEGAELER